MAAEAGISATQTQVMATAKTFVAEWGKNTGKCDPLPLDQYLAKFSSQKRNRLVQSINYANEIGEVSRTLKAFVKCDKYDLVTGETKPPRMIQYASPAVNARIARHLAPAEHAALSGPGYGPTATPMCSKGMGPYERALMWSMKREYFRKPVCLKGDFSKFDAHVHTHTLSLEHDFWCTTTNIPRSFLDAQLINHVKTQDLSWTAVGTRMSGTYNTGGGNSVINIVIMNTVARLAGVDIEILVDGDDSLVFMESSDLEFFGNVARLVIPRVFGMKWEYEAVTDPQLEEYCHSALTIGPDGRPLCVQDPIRALSRAMVVVNKHGRKALGRQLVAALIGLYCGSPNTPVVSRVSYNLLNKIAALDETGRVIYRLDAPDDTYVLEKFRQLVHPHLDEEGILKLPNTHLEVTEESRLTVERAFGLSVNEQLYLESSFHNDIEFNPDLAFTSVNTVKRSLRVDELFPSNDYDHDFEEW